MASLIFLSNNILAKVLLAPFLLQVLVNLKSFVNKYLQRALYVFIEEIGCKIELQLFDFFSISKKNVLTKKFFILKETVFQISAG